MSEFGAASFPDRVRPESWHHIVANCGMRGLLGMVALGSRGGSAAPAPDEDGCSASPIFRE
jgi:hypothetical protein